jgi:hypothetical protein
LSTILREKFELAWEERSKEVIFTVGECAGGFERLLMFQTKPKER